MPERSTKKRNATEMEEEGPRCAVGYSLLHRNILTTWDNKPLKKQLTVNEY